MRKMAQFSIKKISLTKKSVPIFLFLVFFLHTSLFGKINLSQSNDESKFPAIAVNSKGEIMVVWLEWSGDNYYRIFRDGQWSSVKNCGIAMQRAWTNELAIDSQGKFHLTFADGISSHIRDIKYSYFTGSNWASPQTIYYSPYNSAWNKMGIDSNDDIHVVWYHSHIPKTEGTYNSDVVWMKKPKNGTWPTNYENISRMRYTESICSAMAVHKGKVYATWMEGSPQKFPWRLTFSERVGGKWSTPIQLSKLGYYSDMVVDDSGNVHVAFSRRGGNFYAISRIGGKWTSEQVISNGFAPLQFGEIQQKNNTVVAAWVQGKDGNWAIYGSAKIPGGQWNIPAKIADSPGGDDGNKHIHFVIDKNNTAHLVWQEIGVGGKNDIFYEKYSFDTPENATFIEVDNSYLSFQTDDNTSNPGPQTFQVKASGAGSINYTISKDKGWLNVSPLQGSSSGGWIPHTVSVNASNLNDGTYYGTIRITDPSAYNNPMEVGVSLTVGEDSNPPPPPPSPTTVEADTVNLQFTMTEGTNPQAQVFNIRSSSGSAVGYSIVTNMPWFSASPTGGTVGSAWSPISVSIDAKNLLPNTFKGRIDISAHGDTKKTSVYVTLIVEKKNIPYIQIDKSRLYFWGYAHDGILPPKTFRIRNSGSKTLNYKITPNKGWITVTPQQSASTGEWDTITVFADGSSLGVNRHKGSIQIAAPGAENSPQNINVEFEVVFPPQAYPPVDVSVKRLNHEGLIIQEYKSQIDWKANPKNQGLFNIVKYRIFRKNQNQANSFYVYIDEVAANVFTYYDGGFSSKQERNKYTYTVVGVDATGKESQKAETLGVNLVEDYVYFKEEAPEKKKHFNIKKFPSN